MVPESFVKLILAGITFVLLKINNPFSGETVNCPPDFVAVYDTIKGAEMLGEYEHMDKGLDWARQYYPELYIKLLD